MIDRDVWGDGFTTYGRIVADEQSDEEALAEAARWVDEAGMEVHPDGQARVVTRMVKVARGVERPRRTVKLIARPRKP